MNAKELRLGNYLQGEDGQVHIVESLNSYGGEEINEGGPDVYYEPIPLSQEWLLKFGFKDHRILLPGDGELEIRLKGTTFHIWPSDGQTESHNYRNIVEFVHQLQNLYFAITGEELNAIS
jgi:hypothetical protein